MVTHLSKYKLSTRQNLSNKSKSFKHLYKQLVMQDHPYLALLRISVKPPMKICDFTGLPAQYRCPKTSLRFHNLSVFKYLRSLTSEHIEKYYEIKTYGSRIFNNNK